MMKGLGAASEGLAGRKWPAGRTLGSLVSIDAMVSQFKVASSKHPYILDGVFTNEEEMVTNITY